MNPHEGNFATVMDSFGTGTKLSSFQRRIGMALDTVMSRMTASQRDAACADPSIPCLISAAAGSGKVRARVGIRDDQFDWFPC